MSRELENGSSRDLNNDTSAQVQSPPSEPNEERNSPFQREIRIEAVHGRLHVKVYTRSISRRYSRICRGAPATNGRRGRSRQLISGRLREDSGKIPGKFEAYLRHIRGKIEEFSEGIGVTYDRMGDVISIEACVKGKAHPRTIYKYLTLARRASAQFSWSATDRIRYTSKTSEREFKPSLFSLLLRRKFTPLSLV